MCVCGRCGVASPCIATATQPSGHSHTRGHKNALAHSAGQDVYACAGFIHSCRPASLSLGSSAGQSHQLPAASPGAALPALHHLDCRANQKHHSWCCRIAYSSYHHSGGVSPRCRIPGSDKQNVHDCMRAVLVPQPVLVVLPVRAQPSHTCAGQPEAPPSSGDQEKLLAPEASTPASPPSTPRSSGTKADSAFLAAPAACGADPAAPAAAAAAHGTSGCSSEGRSAVCTPDAAAGTAPAVDDVGRRSVGSGARADSGHRGAHPGEGASAGAGDESPAGDWRPSDGSGALAATEAPCVVSCACAASCLGPC